MEDLEIYLRKTFPEVKKAYEEFFANRPLPEKHYVMISALLEHLHKVSRENLDLRELANQPFAEDKDKKIQDLRVEIRRIQNSWAEEREAGLTERQHLAEENDRLRRKVLNLKITVAETPHSTRQRRIEAASGRCRVSRATRSYLRSGLDLPSKPHDEQVELAALRAENERLRAALTRALHGYWNMIEVRRMTNGRYGNLTREEIESEIAIIEAALAGKENKG